MKWASSTRSCPRPNSTRRSRPGPTCIGERSPTALAFLKRSFNADTDSIRGISNMALHAVKLFYATAESKEGVSAFNEKRKPDFRKFAD